MAWDLIYVIFVTRINFAQSFIKFLETSNLGNNYLNRGTAFFLNWKIKNRILSPSYTVYIKWKKSQEIKFFVAAHIESGFS